MIILEFSSLSWLIETVSRSGLPEESLRALGSKGYSTQE